VFTFREAGMQISPVTMSCPSQKTRTASQTCSPLDTKDSLRRKDGFCFQLLDKRRLFDVGGFGREKDC
jgi:hypothetical protein